MDRDAIPAFLADLTERYAAVTVSVRYRALQQFFKWAVLEEELDRAPMEPMQAPVVPEQPVDVLPTADARDLLKVCNGPAFVDRRDTAILMLFLDTGMRLSELAGLGVDDLDMDNDVAFVVGKPPAALLPAGIAARRSRQLRGAMNVRTQPRGEELKNPRQPESVPHAG